MSTHSQFDKVCCLFLAICLIISCFSLYAEDLGVTASDNQNSYAHTLFEGVSVNTIEIIADEEEWADILANASDKEYISCTMLINGEAFNNVAIRTKGNSSLQMVQSSDSDRYSFKIEFDHYDNTKSYHGLDKLTLNNIVQDYTFMKDFLAYTMMGEFGVASPLVNYANVTVNGEIYGLYLAVEAIEEAFLQRNYGTSYGIPYKAESTGGGGGGGGDMGGNMGGGMMGGNMGAGMMGDPTAMLDSFEGSLEELEAMIPQIAGMFTDIDELRAYVAENADDLFSSMGGMPSDMMGGMPSDTMGGMPSDMMGGMPSDMMGGMPSDMMGGMPSDTMGGMPSDTMGGMPSDMMGGMPSDMMGGMPSETQLPSEQTQMGGNRGEVTDPNAQEQTQMGGNRGEVTDPNAQEQTQTMLPSEQIQMGGNRGEVTDPNAQEQTQTMLPSEQTQMGGNRGEITDPNAQEQTQTMLPSEQTQMGGNRGEMTDPNAQEQTQTMLPSEQTQMGGNRGEVTVPNAQEQTQTMLPSEQTQMGGNRGEITDPNAQEQTQTMLPSEQSQMGGNRGEMQMGGQSSTTGTISSALGYEGDDVSSYSYIFDNAAIDFDSSDQTRLIASLKQLSEQENLEEILDIEAVIRYFVVHAFLLNYDSYTGEIMHNYYLYEDNGVLSMLPWDYNLSFASFQTNYSTEALINFPIDTPVSSGTVASRPMLAWIFANEEYTALYHEIFAEFIAQMFDSDYIVDLIDQVTTVIDPYVEADPTKFISYENFTTGVEALKEVVTLRAESVSGQLAGTIPTTSAGQSADSSSFVDTSHIEITATGSTSMNGGGGGGGGDRGQTTDRGEMTGGRGDTATTAPMDTNMGGTAPTDATMTESGSNATNDRSAMGGREQMGGGRDAMMGSPNQMSSAGTTVESNDYALLWVSIAYLLASLILLRFYQKRRF